ncbi:hypothetical protein ACA910_021336 [Epithemia clementina (nom. ined.)]
METTVGNSGDEAKKSFVSTESRNGHASLDNDKLQRVRHVFGDSVVVDSNGEDDSFFMYTPSPAKPDETQKHGSGVSMGQSRLNGSSFDNIKMESVQKHEVQYYEDKENVRASNTPLDTSNSKAPSPALGYSQRSGINRQSRSSASSELIQKTQEAIDRATMSLQQSFRGVPAKQGKHKKKPLVNSGAAKLKNEWDQDLSDAKQFYREMTRKRFEGLQMQRQLSSQASRNKASFHELLRQTKLQRIEEETQFKSSVHRDHAEKLKEERERRRRESEAARAKLRENARLGLERLNKEKMEENAALFEEREAASEALRKARRDAAEQRRKSFQFRSGDAQRIREICAKMRAEQMESQQKSYELERDAARDLDEYRKQIEKERRESLANRGIQARRVKDTEKQLILESQAKASEGHELERAAAKDVADALREEEKQKQKTLADINAEARLTRQRLAKMEAEEMEKRHQSYELERAGDKDVEEYRRKMDQLRRESLVFRGKELVRQLHQSSKERAEEQEAQHKSYELKREAEKDLERYLQEQDKERRNSLANRNIERSRHAKVMKEIELLAREKETESFFLKWAGEKDVEEYEKKVRRERKESLEQRGKEKARIRQQEAEERRKQIEQAHEDEMMRSNDQKEVEAYRRKCAERDRASLEYRNKEARKQRLLEEQAKKEERKTEEENFELETMARKDVEEYINICKQRRRYSLAFRAKEKRQHFQWKEQQKEEERLTQSQIIRGRLMDKLYQELTEQQERAAQTMEAIQHQRRLYASKTKSVRNLLD